MLPVNVCLLLAEDVQKLELTYLIEVSSWKEQVELNADVTLYDFYMCIYGYTCDNPLVICETK